MKKVKKFKLKNLVRNGSAKNKTFRMVETSDGRIVPRDTSYPLDAPGHHAKGDATEVI